MRRYVAHRIYEYLGITANWVYTQIRHTPGYSAYVLAGRVANRGSYPEPRVFSPRLATREGSLYERLFGRLGCLPPPEALCYARALHNYRPALIHAHFGADGFYMLGLKKRFSLPLVTRFYGYDVGILPQIPLWRRRYRRLFAEGDLFIAEGEHMKSLLVALGCPADKAVVHHLGVEVDRIPFIARKRRPGTIRILLAASFREKKGLEYALRATRVVLDTVPMFSVSLKIIGDGPLKARLHELAGELGLDSHIEWCGYLPHSEFLRSLYGADLLMSPSVTAADGDTEGGAPVALIEAQASGLPVVSTLHADIPEVVVDGQTGLLVPERDSSRLAEAVMRLMDDPQLALEMGHSGRLHVARNFDAIQQGRRLAEIYEALCQ